MRGIETSDATIVNTKKGLNIRGCLRTGPFSTDVPRNF